MFCRKCGKELADGVKFCKFCGNPVSNPAVQTTGKLAPYVETTKKSSHGKRILMLLVCFLVVALTAGVFFYLWNNDFMHIPEPESLEEQESEEEEELQAESVPETERKSAISGENQTLETEDNVVPENEEEQGSALTIDLESEIENIREQYNRIVEKRSNGDYERQQVRDGIEAFWDEEELVSVIVPAGTGGIAYSRSYYYADGDLFFAYYEEEDAYRLYFKDEVLIRLRYAKDASKPSDAVNYDQEDSEQYKSWEENTLEEGKSLKHEAKNKYGTNGTIENVSDYIFPDSDSRYLTENDLKGLSEMECKIARNELFARHGRKFGDESLQLYFNSKSWYQGTINPEDFDEHVFNEYEIANRDLIVNYEKEQGYRQ